MALPPARRKTVSGCDVATFRRTLTLPATAGASLAAAAVVTIVTTGGPGGATQPAGTSNRADPVEAVVRGVERGEPMPRAAKDSHSRQQFSLEEPRDSGRVGLEHRIAQIEHRRRRRGELQRVDVELMDLEWRPRRAAADEIGAEALAQIPEHVGPDLAVVVDVAEEPEQAGPVA